MPKNLKKNLNPFMKASIYYILAPAAILFISAGRLNWLMAWIYTGVLALGMGINISVLAIKHPDLIAERSRFKEGSKSWDRALAQLAALFGPGLTLLACGLDKRFEWSIQIPAAFQVVALSIMISGYCLVIWAVVSNRFYSAVVRIQTERGHSVINAGPYRAIRHPGYAGLIVFILSTPLTLGSLPAFLPAALAIFIIIIRTALEDRTLQNELDGYKDYAARTRYRLAPGIW
jgi:protein-S-isoprenylcysteine O-methyltransferase Ste14